MAKQFYIPICVDNLAQFFAFGFITPMSVFPFNHYLPDELSFHSQRIPLFKKQGLNSKMPSRGIHASRQEDENLKSAVVTVSMDESELQESEGSLCMYLDGILPTYLINEITFEDQDAYEHFEYLTRSTGRVSEELLNTIKYRKSGFDKLFQADNSVDLDIETDDGKYPSNNKTSDIDKQALYKMSGYGAALALSYVMTKNSSFADESYKKLAELDKDDSGRFFVVIEAISYLLQNSEEEDLQHRIRNEFFDSLIGCESHEKVLDKLVSFFGINFGNDKVSEFLNDLKELSGNILKGKIQETKSEQMNKDRFFDVKRVSQFIEQVVTMFSNLQETEKLFSQPVQTVNGAGYINLAIAYGFRDKFFELPKVVRQINGLETFILESMYRYYQHITGQTVPEKRQFPLLPTIVDILLDPEVPELKYALSQKFGLISKDLKQDVIIANHSYIPEKPSELIEVYETGSDEFTQKMVEVKAFDNIDFNMILEIYSEEKVLMKARKKLEKRLSKL